MSFAGISPGENDYCTFADKGYMDELKELEEAMKDPTPPSPAKCRYSIYYSANCFKAGENSFLDEQGKDSIGIVPSCFRRLFSSLICCCRGGAAQDSD